MLFLITNTLYSIVLFHRSYNQTLRWKTLDPLALLDDFDQIFSNYGDKISGAMLRDLFNRVSDVYCLKLKL